MIYLSDADFTLYNCDVLEGLAQLEDESVHCVVTSPPYWGLRDYGTGTWEGGDAECDHQRSKLTKEQMKEQGAERGYVPTSNFANYGDGYQSSVYFRDECGKCGARRIDNQLGLEPTPEAYIERMVEVFREVRRVLRKDGTCWLNIGDSYANVPRGDISSQADRPRQDGNFTVPSPQQRDQRRSMMDKRGAGGLKAKDLCMIHARLALALQQPYYTGKIKREADRIWLAAVIEAEGCMFIHKRKVGQSNGQGYERKTASFGAGLEVSSTDRVVVERCLEITGLGSICEQGPEQNARRKQTLYRWNLRSNACRDVIRELYPHLIAKRHEARLLLGCPSSGPEAAKAHESLKAIHQGQAPCIDFDDPQSLFERGWFVRSAIVWAKLFRTRCQSQSATARPRPMSSSTC